MPNLSVNPTLGVEIEMPVADRTTGASVDARGVFPRLLARRQARGEPAEPILADGEIIGIAGPLAVSSVDNGFNNLESALGVVGGPTMRGSGLCRLAELVHAEVGEVAAALAEENAGIVNFAEHPALAIDEPTYRALRAPKPIYDYWRGARGWRHEEGIDAKAQNGPTTGVTAEEAATSLNLVLLSAPGLIALFANSPFEANELTGLKENRLTLWPRMFAAPALPGDDRFHVVPERPFADLADYFRWMFGAGRAMQAIPVPGNSYKGFGDLLRVEGDPCLLDFLRRPTWRARSIGAPRDAEPVDVSPDMRIVEALQFSQFLDGRVRFHFRSAPATETFLDALAGSRVEELFAGACASVYIEGRACGATFPDDELCDLPDPLVAASAMIAPSAIQKGLQVNKSSYGRLSRFLPWRDIPAAREAAIRDGLQGRTPAISLHTFATALVDEAEAGLKPEERWMLSYPRYVLDSNRNGADRAIEAFERRSGDRATRIRRLVRERTLRRLPPLPDGVSLAAVGGERLAVA